MVRCMLQKDPERRPSCVELLNHPWIQQPIGEREFLSASMIDSTKIEVAKNLDMFKK